MNPGPLGQKSNALTTEPKSRLPDAVVRDWIYTQKLGMICFMQIFVTECRQLWSRPIFKETIWAASWQNQQTGMCIHPVWSESSLAAWRKLGSLATHWAYSEDSDAQADLSFCWVHRSFCGFCHEAAHFECHIFNNMHKKTFLILFLTENKMESQENVKTRTCAYNRPCSLFCLWGEELGRLQGADKPDAKVWILPTVAATVHEAMVWALL